MNSLLLRFSMNQCPPLIKILFVITYPLHVSCVAPP
uniref:Uncharacterized protein n=1 Tax=Arundo donax TaxID=35708 RepID=A0A0A9BIM1_ARUDO